MTTKWQTAKMPEVKPPEGEEDIAWAFAGAPSLTEEEQLAQLLKGNKCRHDWKLVKEWSTDPQWPESHEEFLCKKCKTRKRLTWGIGMLYPTVAVRKG